MSSYRAWFALSEHPIARTARTVRHAIKTFSLPVPVLIARPLLGVFLTLRQCYYFLVRVLICEPLFKAYCTQYGRGVRTGVYLPWVSGGGKLILGNNILIDGKAAFMFAVRYAKDPTLMIGDNTVISHGCSFTVGRQVTIGKHCLIAGDVMMFDAPGHPIDPAQRKLGAPANLQDVRPIEIQDNVWIGTRAIIFPGVTVGEGSVIASASVVTNDVPPYTLVAGNPARVIKKLLGENASKLNGNTPTLALNVKHSGAFLHEVMEILRNILRTDQLSPDEDFYDAGVTSIMALPLLVEIERQFGVTVPESAFLEARTGRELTVLLGSLGRERL